LLLEVLIVSLGLSSGTISLATGPPLNRCSDNGTPRFGARSLPALFTFYDRIPYFDPPCYLNGG